MTAIGALRRYPGTVALAAMNLALFLGGGILGVHGELVAEYAFSLDRLVGRPAVLLVSGLLHADLAHVLYNTLFLGLFGRVCEDVLGTTRTLLLYLAGMVAGNLLFAALAVAGLPGYGPGSQAIGASGAVFGLIAAAMLLEPGRPVWGDVPLPFGLLGVAYIVPALGQAGSTAGGVAHIAHVGGAVAGFLLTFAWAPDRARDGIWAFVGFGVLVVALFGL